MKKVDELLDKTNEMTDKAEKAITEGYEKAKESETYARISDLMGQVGGYVDKKIEELKQSDIPDQMENLRQKAEAKSETIVDQAKAYGNIIVSDIEEVIGNVKDKLRGKGEKK